MIPAADLATFALLNETNIQRFLAYKMVLNLQDREDIRQEFLLTLAQQPAALTKGGSYLTAILDRTKIHYYRRRGHAWTKPATGVWPSLDNTTTGWDHGPCLTDSTAAIDNAIYINDFEQFLFQKEKTCLHRTGNRTGPSNALACFFTLLAGKQTDKLLYKSFQKYRNLYRKRLTKDYGYGRGCR